MQKTHYTAK